MGERLFRRGLIWYAWVPKAGGGVEKRSTLCTDKKAALIVAAQLERAAVDPDYAAQNEARLTDMTDAYLTSRERLGRSAGTMHHVRVKSGHLRRLLPDMASRVDHATVEKYIDQRLKEGARRTTIKKELRVLKASLRLGAKNGLFKADPDNVIPELEDDYVPVERYLLPWELVALVTSLKGDGRAAMAVFIVVTSARWGEAVRAERVDVVERGGCVFVKLRGTKTKKSRREVPIVGDVAQSLLDWSLGHALPSPGRLFPSWVSVRRDLHAACKRAGIPPCSPNDLRRTFATWLQQAGAGNDLIAQMMGHTDTRQVERVYGRMNSDDLARLLGERLAGHAAAPAPPPPPPLLPPPAEDPGVFPPWFAKHVVVGAGDECWLWAGPRTPSGYGLCPHHGLGETRAHRMAWRLATGNLSSETHVLHHCDVPFCVRPEHLFLGTHADNMRDKAAKGRAPQGEAHPQAKLSWEQVEAIRSNDTDSVTAMAARYGVDRKTVRNVLRDLTWTDGGADSLMGESPTKPKQ